MASTSTTRPWSSPLCPDGFEVDAGVTGGEATELASTFDLALQPTRR